MSRAVRLGIFIVFTLAILAAGIFLIGNRQFLFSSTYILKAPFKNVAGLNNGAEVRVGGINKRKRQTDPVTGSTRCRNDTFGSDNAPNVEDGSSINGVPPLDISDLMKKTDQIL